MASYRKHAANTLCVYLLSELVSAPPFCRSCSCKKCLWRWFLDSRAFGQSARALEVAVYLNVPSLDTQSFNLPPSPTLSGSLFFGGSHKNAPGTHYNSPSREHSLLIKPPPPVTLTHLLTHSCFSPPSTALYHHLLAAVGLCVRVTQFTAAPLSQTW